MITSKLKRCPFCGGKAEVRDGSIYLDKAKLVRCKNCHIQTVPVIVDHPSFTEKGLDESTRYTPEQAEQKACDVWNRRVDEQTLSFTERVELGNEFLQWAKKNGVAKTPFSVITWLIGVKGFRAHAVKR